MYTSLIFLRKKNYSIWLKMHLNFAIQYISTMMFWSFFTKKPLLFFPYFVQMKNFKLHPKFFFQNVHIFNILKKIIIA
jgi:hypothetical protein